MLAEEVKYHLQVGGWTEDRWGRFVHFGECVRFKGKFDEITEVCQLSAYNQWVVVSRTETRHVKREGKYLAVGSHKVKVKRFR